jgi:hypothetical protein
MVGHTLWRSGLIVGVRTLEVIFLRSRVTIATDIRHLVHTRRRGTVTAVISRTLGALKSCLSNSA